MTNGGDRRKGGTGCSVSVASGVIPKVLQAMSPQKPVPAEAPQLGS